MAYKPLIKRILCYAVASIMPFLAAVANAEDSDLHISAHDAVSIVLKRSKGTVVGVEKQTQNSKTVYRVRLIQDGHVRDFFVNAISGKLSLDNEQE